METALLNARVLTPQGWRDDLAVVVADGLIRALVSPDDVPSSAKTHDLSRRTLLPGFIDCQVNGGGGVLFNDQPTAEGIRAIGSAHRRFGTTGFLPTLISDTPGKMRTAVAAVDAAIAEGVPGVLGIHLEGPFLSRERRGVHAAKFLHAPDAGELRVAESLARGVTLLTLAPECVAPAAIRELAAHGVIIAAGHSNADCATVRAALDAGMRGFTHLYNAMSPLTSRAPGMVGAALDDTDSCCGVIVDGHHVAPTSLRVALKAKTRGKVFLVTDAMPPVGAKDPSYTLNGEVIIARDGICQTADGTLAGSALGMIDAVRNTVEMLGLPLDEAARMASTYPADFLGLGASHGRIKAGYRANFTVIDADLRVTDTWIDGRPSDA
ncbi:MAG: N-acetylglucosamine-6-phosphate deacetylase [Rhodanobacteraceae bacterium]|jgi:N-acetylglucosamine-6-phosphate deacetylase|nr:MAG: N-acetylglucosamine-6-phosphate deacetylase [Rhodanobacteraceae bacterium]